MDFWITYALLFLHFGAAICWAGGAVFVSVVLVPGIESMPQDAQRGAWLALLHRIDGYLTRAGLATIAFGAASGIALQRYNEALGLQTRYGIAIAAGAVLAITAFALGKWSGVIAERVVADDRYWGDDERLVAERDRVLVLSSRLDRVELAILPIVIALMALARLS